MLKVQLGQTSVSVTRLGLGLGPLGGLYSSVRDADAVATIDRAWEHGIRFFDTAPFYGYGRAEERAGIALSRRPRDEFVLSTKVGRLIVPGESDGSWADAPPGVIASHDYTYDGVIRSVTESLDRLRMSRVDLLHIHDPDDYFDDARTGALAALADLKARGEIGAVSAGMNQVAMLTEFARSGAFDCFLLAGRITLLDRSGLDEFLPLCQSRGISVIAAGVFQSGLLADPRLGVTDNYAPVSPARLARALELKDICASFGVPLRAAAIQYPLQHEGVASVLVGCRTPAEVDDAVAMFNYPVPSGLWEAL